MRSILAYSIALMAVGCASSSENPYNADDPEQGSFEGVDEDNDPSAPLDDGKSDIPRYAIPTDLPQLVSPEIIVSLDGLTVHLFDRETGFQAVYPTGVGVKNSAGKSITPTGHYATGDDTTDTWWYVARRTNPEYFAGFPFLRLTIENSAGANTYALHGPITATLQRGYVSHGCVRMRGNDIVRLFWLVKTHPNTPITIQKEWELDAAGKKVDVGTHPTLWGVGDQIRFGASVGPRPF